MTISYRQLKHALALYHYGSFRRAAEASHLSQPAFSRSIGSLERKLGATLFNRESKQVTATVFGEALLKRARSIVDETQEIQREIRLLSGLEAGDLSVAMGTFPAAISGSVAAADIARRHPRLHCRFAVGDWLKVANDVLGGTVELGISDVSLAEADERLETEVVGRHPLLFYCRKDHPLAALPAVSKAQLDAYPLAAIRLPARLAATCPGGTTVDPATGNRLPMFEVEDMATARAIVAGSNAVSGGSPAQVRALLDTGNFAVLPYRQADLRLNYGFIYLRERMLSPAALWFMQRVRDIEAQLAIGNQTLVDEMLPQREDA